MLMCPSSHAKVKKTSKVQCRWHNVSRNSWETFKVTQWKPSIPIANNILLLTFLRVTKCFHGQRVPILIQRISYFQKPTSKHNLLTCLKTVVSSNLLGIFCAFDLMHLMKYGFAWGKNKKRRITKILPQNKSKTHLIQSIHQSIQRDLELCRHCQRLLSRLDTSLIEKVCPGSHHLNSLQVLKTLLGPFSRTERFVLPVFCLEYVRD